MPKLSSIIITTFLIVTTLSSNAFAGGAAARRRKPPQQAQQQGPAQKMQQEKELHEQLLAQQEQKGAPDEVMDFDALWEELAVSSEIWMRIVDRQIKALIVETYIDWYREQGIEIKKSQVDYMLLIDTMALQNPGLFERPFQDVLMFVAVMEYDFDNGTNKDQLAQKVLGPQIYEINRRRLGGK